MRVGRCSPTPCIALDGTLVLILWILCFLDFQRDACLLACSNATQGDQGQHTNSAGALAQRSQHSPGGDTKRYLQPQRVPPAEQELRTCQYLLRSIESDSGTYALPPRRRRQQRRRRHARECTRNTPLRPRSGRPLAARGPCPPGKHPSYDHTVSRSLIRIQER